MRLRNVKGSREQIAANEYTIKDAEQIKGQWKDYFQDGKPIQLEIGMGKGKFLMQLAEKNPQIHYIGIEKYSSVLVRALEKMEENPLENLHFIRMDAENIVNVFEKGEVDQIYLNFSDPWPKDRHAKRRLTSRQFLERYHNILKEEGRVIFKTDNRPLFDFSLEEVKEADCTRIFDKFYRVENSRSLKTGGTGLGLAIAKNIINLHEGNIWATSDESGTRFQIELPVVQAHMPNTGK